MPNNITQPILAKLKEYSANDLDLRSLLDFLYEQNKMPDMERVDSLGYGVTGDYSPWYNKIRFANGADLNTVIHELTHATEGPLHQRWVSPNSDDEQFKDAYSKLIFGGNFDKTPNKIRESMEKLDPSWYQQTSDYRKSTGEAKAFAVGNSLGDRIRRNNPDVKQGYLGTYKGGSHVDSTLATDQAILLELANRKWRNK